jgi:hypothetical protein
MERRHSWIKVEFEIACSSCLHLNCLGGFQTSIPWLPVFAACQMMIKSFQEKDLP